MAFVEPKLDALRIPRLAAVATSVQPAWLWSADASRILWANAVAAAIFGAATLSDCMRLRFDAKNPSAAQVRRLAATLPPSGQERLERLRGFGAGFGGTLTCTCARIVLPDGTAAIVIASNEPAGPALSLRERVRRLFADEALPLAVFSPDGALLHATSAAEQVLGEASSVSALGIEALAAKAWEAGRANGSARLGRNCFETALRKIGQQDSRVLLVTLPPPQSRTTPHEAAPPRRESAPAPVRTEAQPEVEPETAPQITKQATAPLAAVVEPPPPPAPFAKPAPTRPAATSETPLTERRHPLRFVWQMDADGRFVLGSDEFIELVGPRTTTACGRLWSEIAAVLKLDPEQQVARAVATHETWSGILISWPVDESNERLPVELSGLPIFDRDRVFCGYRGFGVCRDVERINQLARARRSRPIGFVPAAEPSAAAAAPASAPNAGPAAQPQTAASAAQPVAAPALQPEPAEIAEPAVAPPTAEIPSEASAAPPTANVVPFRSGAAAEAKAPSLSPVERNAFHELAQELTARLRAAPDEANGDETAVEGAAPQDAVVAAGDAKPAAASGGETANPSGEIAGSVVPIAPPPAAEEKQETSPPERLLLDRIAAGILVYRDETPLYANRHFFELTGHDSLEALQAAGGLNALFAPPGADKLAGDGAAQKLFILTLQGEKVPVNGRVFTLPWHGVSALALSLTSAQAEERQHAAEAALGDAENEIRELKSSVDRTARREAQKSAAAKADFLAKVSHEIRTPLNSMIGFAEVIMAERFGSIGNERYREYLKDMHAAGTHIVSLLNDLLDLSKIETGQLDLNFVNVDLNDLTQQCVGIMQPQANRARIIIRSALTPGLPHVLADARSLRQIVLNLLANAIKYTGPGGQVIVSTAVTDGGEVVLRVRDTGVGMREKDIDAVLDPFRDTATAGSWGSNGTGLGLPLTKALAEANRATFSIKSAPNAGTLVEIAFPSSRMIAQ